MARSRIHLFLTLAPSLLDLANAAQWNIINDARVTNRDITPALGRGLSVSTGEILSSCLVIGTLTDPTSDYEYFFTEITQDTDFDKAGMAQVAGGGAGMFGYLAFHGGATWANQTNTKIHYMTATMTIDRYYSSIDEAEATFVKSAQVILGRKNFMQFFQACGPNYIRSIRKESRLVTVFSYRNRKVTTNNSKNGGVHIFGAIGGSFLKRGGESSDNRNMQINIYAFGMSLQASQISGGNLVVQSMAEYAIVMAIGFQSMQDPLSGIIKSVELNPWVNNPAFQVASGVNIPFSRNIYRCLRDDAGDTVNITGSVVTCYDKDSDGVNIDNLSCGWTTHDPPLERFDTTMCGNAGTEDALNKEIRKFNMIANSEYLANIDSLIRNDLMSLSVHTNCVTRLLDYHSSFKNERIFNHRNDTERETNLPTVLEVRNRLTFGDEYMAGITTDQALEDLDPFPTNFKTRLEGRGLLHERKARAINSKIQNFVFPCYQNMQSEVYLIEQGMMQYKHWTNIDVCKKVKCTFAMYEWAIGGVDCTAVTGDLNGLQELLDSYCPADLYKWHSGTVVRNNLNIGIPDGSAARPNVDID